MIDEHRTHQFVDDRISVEIFEFLQTSRGSADERELAEPDLFDEFVLRLRDEQLLLLSDVLLHVYARTRDDSQKNTMATVPFCV